MLQLFQWLEGVYNVVAQSSFGIAINLTLRFVAVTEVVHLLVLAVLGCAVLVVDLRLLGWGQRRQPVAHVAREARPWLIWSLIGWSVPAARGVESLLAPGVLVEDELPPAAFL